LLADYFLKHFSTAMNKPVKPLSPSVRQALLAHPWPGNVRELRNVIERVVILETSDQIQPASLPDFRIETRLRKSDTPVLPRGASLEDTVNQFERDLILATLEQTGFNVARAAEALKLTRHALRYRMRRHHLQVEADSDDDAEAQKEKEPSPC
jgi:transcriptional regulator with PAS, ATPase and Fis domain